MPTQSISMPLPTDGGTVIILPSSCITMLKLRISKKLAKSFTFVFDTQFGTKRSSQFKFD